MKKLFFIFLILIISGCAAQNGPVIDKDKHYDSTDKFGMFLYNILGGSGKKYKK